MTQGCAYGLPLLKIMLVLNCSGMVFISLSFISLSRGLLKKESHEELLSCVVVCR